MPRDWAGLADFWGGIHASSASEQLERAGGPPNAGKRYPRKEAKHDITELPHT